jgi:hypothetical protein
MAIEHGSFILECDNGISSATSHSHDTNIILVYEILYGLLVAFIPL